MPSSLRGPEPELQGLSPHFSPPHFTPPGWGLEEARLRRQTPLSTPGCCSKAKTQERAAKTGSTPDGLQGEPGVGTRGPQCPPPGFWLLPINVHQGLDSSHTHGTGGVFQGHAHNPLQRHAGLHLGLSLRCPLACGLKDPGPTPPAPGASPLAPVPEAQPLPRAASSGLGGRSREFAYDPMALTQAHRQLISHFRGRTLSPLGTWPGHQDPGGVTGAGC